MKIHEPEVVGDLTLDAPLVTDDVEAANVSASESMVIPLDEPTILVNGSIWLT